MSTRQMAQRYANMGGGSGGMYQLGTALGSLFGSDKLTGGPILDPQTGQIISVKPYEGGKGFFNKQSRAEAQQLNQQLNQLIYQIQSQKELANLEAANRMVELDTKQTYDTTARNELAGIERELAKYRARLAKQQSRQNARLERETTRQKANIETAAKTGGIVNKQYVKQLEGLNPIKFDTYAQRTAMENAAANDSRMLPAYVNAELAALEAVPLKNAVTVNKGQSTFLPPTAANILKSGSTLTGAEEVETPTTYDAKGMPIFGGKRTIPATLTDTTLSPDIAAAVMSQPQASAAQPVVEAAQPLFPLPNASAPLSFDPSLLGAMFNPKQQTAPISAAQQNTNGVPMMPNTFTNAGWNNDPIARQAAAQAAAAQNRKALFDMLKRLGVDFVQRADDALFPNRIR